MNQKSEHFQRKTYLRAGGGTNVGEDASKPSRSGFDPLLQHVSFSENMSQKERCLTARVLVRPACRTGSVVQSPATC